MDIAIITSGIKAIMRAAQAGIDIHVERTVDSQIFLPNIRLPKEDMGTKITEFLRTKSNLQSSSPFSAGWNADIEVWNPTTVINKQDCIGKYLELSSAEDLINRSDEEKNQLLGGRMIEQWRFDKKPPSAWAKIALTLTDISLEFVATTPEIMGEQSKGEKLVIAFAKTLSDLIPNDVNEMGAAEDFSNRLLGIFLRAGLTTLLADKDTIIEDKDVKALVNGIIKPISEKLPDNFNQQVKYRAIVETLISDSAEAALSIIAKKPDVYLGDKFVSDQALKAVTTALLETTANAAAGNNILDVLSKQGVKKLFNSALSVAIEQPNLFISENAGAENQQLLIDLFVNVAQSVKQANTQGFSKEMGISFSAMVVKTVGQHAAILLKLNPDSPWENVAITIINDMTQTLSKAIANNERFKLLSQEQQHRFGQIILQQMAQTPAMLGVNNPEIKNVITGVAEAMSADDNFLISNEEWLQIAAIAAQIATSDPAKLFDIETDNKAKKLGVVAIKSILNVVGGSLSGNRNTPLNGHILSSAITMVLNALTGNIKGAISRPEIIEEYFQSIVTNIAQSPEKWGSKAILAYISETVESVLVNGTLPLTE